MSLLKLILVALLCWSPVVRCFGQTQEKQKRSADIAALLGEGESLTSKGRLAEAEIPLERAVLLAPDNFDVLTSLGKVKARLGERSDAIVLLRKAVLANPDSGDAHLNLAIVLADNSDLKAALAETAKAIKLSPNSPAAHFNRARMLTDAGQQASARMEFRTASLLAPKDPDIFFFWAMLESQSQNAAKASLLLKKVVRLQPQNFQAYFLHGKSLEDQGQETEAIGAWRRAVALDPEYKEAVYSLGQALRATDPESSRRLLGQFRELQEKSELVEQVRKMGNRAYASMVARNWAASIDLLNQAIAKCGSCELQAGLHQHLGLAECHAGNLDKGEIELQRALSLNPNDRQTVEALQWVSRQREHGSGQLE